jgi:SAM-dependent methyltransferase
LIAAAIFIATVWGSAPWLFQLKPASEESDSLKRYLSKAVDVVNALLIRTKRSQRIVPKGKPVKVNFGSSLIVQDGWINVEGTLHAVAGKWPTGLQKLLYRGSSVREWLSEEEYLRILRTQPFVHHDLDFGLPFPDNSVDYLYASHVLEHFYPDVGQNILRDAHRVLKKGGRMRICVPDLKHAFDLYLKGEKERALAYFYQDSRSIGFHRHKYMYDLDVLEAALKRAGFSFIEQQNYRCGQVPEADKLDNRPEETLYVEAVK